MTRRPPPNYFPSHTMPLCAYVVHVRLTSPRLASTPFPPPLLQQPGQPMQGTPHRIVGRTISTTTDNRPFDSHSFRPPSAPISPARSSHISAILVQLCRARRQRQRQRRLPISRAVPPPRAPAPRTIPAARLVSSNPRREAAPDAQMQERRRLGARVGGRAPGWIRRVGLGLDGWMGG